MLGLFQVYGRGEVVGQDVSRRFDQPTKGHTATWLARDGTIHKRTFTDGDSAAMYEEQMLKLFNIKVIVN